MSRIGAAKCVKSVEKLAGGVAISTVLPKGAGRCENDVSFCYPKGVATSRPDFVLAHQEAYWETAAEDDEIAMRMQAGRDVLVGAGLDQNGPVHRKMEAGIIEFHDWIRSRSWAL